MASLLVISEEILKIYSQNIYTNSTAYRVERTVCSLLILTTQSPVVGLRNSLATASSPAVGCYRNSLIPRLFYDVSLTARTTIIE
jgi:hypothetical protein